MAKRERKLSEESFPIGEPSEILRISIAYEEGGANWFHGTTSPRGYFVRVIPTRIKEGFSTITLGEGSKALIEPAKRFSEKKLAEVSASPDLIARLVAKVTADRETRNARRGSNAATKEG